MVINISQCICSNARQFELIKQTLLRLPLFHDWKFLLIHIDSKKVIIHEIDICINAAVTARI